jgi:hypothetical protein
MAEASTVFVVSRLNWRPTGPGNWWLAPGATRLASYAERDAAERERARREANARGRVNPFRCGLSFPELSALPEDVYCDWVSDADLTPPEPGAKGRDWGAWWDGARPELSAERLAHLWDGLGKVRFFRTDERPDVPLGYVVLSLCWHYNDEYNYLNEEGGEVQAVYRTRARAADAARGARAYGARAYGDGAAGGWHPSGADLFDPETYWELAVGGGPRFDIVEIELEGLG